MRPAEFVPRLELRRTIVVAEKPAQALPPPNAPARVLIFNCIDQLVVQALMVAFAMIVGHKLPERTTEMLLTQRNEPVQALFLD